jgi:hypothetical protein
VRDLDQFVDGGLVSLVDRGDHVERVQVGQLLIAFAVVRSNPAAVSLTQAGFPRDGGPAPPTRPFSDYLRVSTRAVKRRDLPGW